MSTLGIILIFLIIAIIALIIAYFVYRNKNIDFIDKKKQVYNISENVFNYEQAQAVCRANNAELASLEQMIKAYEQGADWCNYGWSKNQLALYPTQLETWTRNQNTDMKDSCGKPGVNGGYFENTNNLFGVNCYGVKPPRRGQNVNNPPYQAVSDIDMNASLYKGANFEISPFNKNKWSQY